jgi:hypothetical protein
MMKNYQRRHLRAPFKENLLYADGPHVLKAKTLNISAGGLLLSELPSIPHENEISLMISLPQIPNLKNFGLLKMQTFSKELFGKYVIRAKGRLVRRDELAQSLDNIFLTRFGLEFTVLEKEAQKCIEEYISAFSANIIFLQTLIDSFNTDEETRLRTRTLAKILGYNNTEKIAQLRSLVTHDYKSLQWL